MMQVPEEYRDEVLEIVYKLKRRSDEIFKEIAHDFDIAVEDTKIDILHPKDLATKKALGLYLTKGPGRARLKHPTMMFPILNSRRDMVDEYCRKMSRPTSNQL